MAAADWVERYRSYAFFGAVFGFLAMDTWAVEGD